MSSDPAGGRGTGRGGDRAAGGYGGYGAIVLAGGATRRLGGRPKPVLRIAGRPLLDRVLAAVADARPRVVVGPPLPAPPGVLFAREDPPGGGPVVAAAAGLAAFESAGSAPYLALLAADLPFLDRSAVGALLRAAADPGVDAALYVDDAGRRQLLCGVWRTDALRDRLRAVAATGLAGAPLRRVVAGARIAEVTARAGARPPWFDCDTEQDLDRAERWSDGNAG